MRVSSFQKQASIDHRGCGEPSALSALTERIIANSLTDQWGHNTFQIPSSGADYGQPAPNRLLLLRPESLLPHAALQINTFDDPGSELAATSKSIDYRPQFPGKLHWQPRSNHVFTIFPPRFHQSIFASVVF
jgi:hypothetical protein